MRLCTHPRPPASRAESSVGTSSSRAPSRSRPQGRDVLVERGRNLPPGSARSPPVRRPAARRVLRARRAVCVAGLATPGADDLHRRARADAAVARDRRDRRAGPTRRAVRPRDSRRLRAGAGVVARLGNGLVCHGEARARPRDDSNRVSRLRPGADGGVSLARSGSGRRRDGRPRARVLLDPRRRAARLPARRPSRSG